MAVSMTQCAMHALRIPVAQAVISAQTGQTDTLKVLKVKDKVNADRIRYGTGELI